MDRILIILKKRENLPRASSAPALGLNTIIFKHVYWYMQQISGEPLQDHWSSGFSHAGTLCKLLKTIHFQMKNIFFCSFFLKFCIKRKCYTIKQLLTIESLNMM